MTEKQYKELRKDYNRVVNYSENFSSELTPAIEGLQRPYSENNLKALSSKENRSVAEDESLEECKFVEQRKEELRSTYDNYFNVVNKINSAFKNFVPLMNRQKELNEMLEVLKEENEVQDRASDIKATEEELSAFRTQIDTAGSQLVELLHNADDYVNKFNDLSNKEKFESSLKEHMDEFNRSPEMAEKREEEKRLSEENERKRQEEEKAEQEKNAQREREIKEKAERDKQLKAEQEKKDLDETINSFAYEKGNFNFYNQTTLDSKYEEYVKNSETFNDTKTYSVHGTDKKLTLQEATENYKNLRIKELSDNLKNSQNAQRQNDLGEIESGLKRGSDLVNEYIPNNISNVRERVEKFSELDSYVVRNGNDFGIDPNYPVNIETYSKTIGVANGLAKLHHQSKKPGFFSRLFNTSYNKSYNREQSILDKYGRELLSGGVDPDYVAKITGKDTCYEALDKNELLKNCYDVKQQKERGYNVMNVTQEDVKKVAENDAKICLLTDIYNGKNPIETFNEYFKENGERAKDNVKEDEHRKQITVEEAAPEKQGVKNKVAQSDAKVVNLEMEKSANSK